MTDIAMFHGKRCSKCHVNPAASRNGRCKRCHADEMKAFRAEQKLKLAADARTLEEILARLRRADGRKTKKLSKGKDNGQSEGNRRRMPPAAADAAESGRNP